MLSKEYEVSLSKRMTKILRHDPASYGLALDPHDGSVPVEGLLHALRRLKGWQTVTMENLQQVVANSDKQRFEIKGDRIRARYGHSVERVTYEAGHPPAVLYHGTGKGTTAVILKDGIRPMGRQYVHLSEGLQFASLAGKRKGQLAMIAVDTAKAAREGVTFYFAGNEVWLADYVPADCCSIYKPEARKR